MMYASSRVKLDHFYINCKIEIDLNPLQACQTTNINNRMILEMELEMEWKWLLDMGSYLYIRKSFL